MSSAPPNGKATTGAGAGRIAATGSSVDKPRPGAKPPMTPEQRHQMTVALIAIAVVLMVGAGVYGYFNWRTPSGPPRLNEDPIRLAKFTSTREFDQLPYDRQRLYMKTLGDRKDEIKEKFAANQISKDEYADTLAIIWLGKQFKRVDNFYGMGELDKKHYLDELLDKAAIDDAKDEAELDKVKRDKDKVKLLVQRFPAKDRQQYEAFRAALKDREKEREKQAKAAAKAAKNATRPTTRPGDPGT